MKLRAHGNSDIGLVRQRNEDSFVVDVKHGFFAVADGLGGLPGGDAASSAAVATVCEEFRRKPAPSRLGDLRAIVEHAHLAVRRAGLAFEPEQIGTTLTLARILEGGTLQIAHVGDSFGLLVRNNVCRALTREHNVENERTGPMDLAPFPPMHRYALTRIVGGYEPVSPDLFEEALKPGDKLVLATDGMTDLVEFKEIAAILDQHREPDASVDALVAEALRRGGHDNITVIVVFVDAV